MVNSSKFKKILVFQLKFMNFFLFCLVAGHTGNKLPTSGLWCLFSSVFIAY